MPNGEACISGLAGRDSRCGWPLFSGTASTTATGQTGAVDIIQLPAPRTQSAYSLEQASRERRSVRRFSPAAPTLEEGLPTALGGAERGSRVGTEDSTLGRRPISAATYLVAANVTGIKAGVYRHLPQTLALTPIGLGNTCATLAAGHPWGRRRRPRCQRWRCSPRWTAAQRQNTAPGGYLRRTRRRPCRPEPAAAGDRPEVGGGAPVLRQQPGRGGAGSDGRRTPALSDPGGTTRLPLDPRRHWHAACLQNRQARMQNSHSAILVHAMSKTCRNCRSVIRG